MKRGLSVDWKEPPPGPILNLGSGNHPIQGCTNLDRPDWEAPYLPAENAAVAAVHAYHFLEHLTPEVLQDQMREVARVLMSGGLFYYCVPYAMSPIAFMDATHRTFWTEETMRTLLQSRGYQSAVVEDVMKLRFQVIMGITSQNLAVLGILEKNN